MTIALFLTVIAAIAGAISAAARTYTKLKPTNYYPNRVKEAKSEEADQPRLQPDVDSERFDTVETPVQANTSEASLIAIPPMIPIAEPEIPLATSLKISDVVDSDLSIKSQSVEHQAHSVLDEVEQLEQFDERLNQLEHQATNTDHLIRLAVAVELGELAKQGQLSDRAITLLNQLTQDADLEVRVQAGASMALISVKGVSE